MGVQQMSRERMREMAPEIEEVLEMIKKMDPAHGNKILQELEVVFRYYNSLVSLIEKNPEEVLKLSDIPQRIMGELILEFVMDHQPEGREPDPSQVAMTCGLIGLMIGLTANTVEDDDDDPR